MGSMVRHSLVFSLYEASFSQFFTRLDTMSGSEPASHVLLFSAQPQPLNKRTAHRDSVRKYQILPSSRRNGPKAEQAQQKVL